MVGELDYSLLISLSIKMLDGTQVIKLFGSKL